MNNEQIIQVLVKALQFYHEEFHVHKSPGGLIWKPSEALLDDCGNVAKEALSQIEGGE